jgi:hypothetical protein
MSWIRRFWQITRWPPVLWAGIPSAIVAAVWSQFDATSYAWSSLWSGRFVVRLVVSILVQGYIGGLIVGMVLRNAASRLGIQLPKDWQ